MRPGRSPRSSLPRIAILGLALALVASTSCAAPGNGRSAKELAGSRAVTFLAADGVRLAGRLFPSKAGGSSGVVLSHMLPTDQRSWFPFAERLAAEGFSALTFDFRGYCPGGDGGCSRGTKDIASIWRDVAAAAAFLRGQGVRTLSLVGASMGGTASLIAAAGPQPPAGDVAAVITLSSPLAIEGLSVTPELLLTVQAAKLFIASLGDGESATSAQQLYDLSSSPKREEIIPVDGHGTDLLTSNQGEEVQRLILSTLDQYMRAPVAGAAG
jgi:pimeloyl-ACP methyl ester carboxylesterase